MVGRWGNWIKMLGKNSGREWEERCSSNFPRMEQNGKTYFPQIIRECEETCCDFMGRSYGGNHF